MQNFITQRLLEARREYMSKREKVLKKKLINLLRDDGKGHHHAKYAERLEDFDIQIVPLRVDPSYTASIGYDTGIIKIGEGLLTDPATFYQLNVLIRHELAHNLLMHQIRMSYKLGESTFVHTGISQVLHNLYNIIGDDEISNRKYSEEDKSIMRNLIINGEAVQCLVTEDHRSDWVDLSIEEMYDRICEEIATIQKQLSSGYTLPEVADRISDDYISSNILNTYIYTDIDCDSMIPGLLKDFVAKGCAIEGGRLHSNLREIVTNIFEKLEDKAPDDTEVRQLLTKIAKSSPVESVDLFDDKSVLLYSPEEKLMAVEVIKKYKSEYAEWFDKVRSSLTELSAEELKELYELLK